MMRGHTSRRTEGLRVKGRSARVVDEVLRVTIEELGRVGYAALRFDDIARQSGVNKTTIYRRWPTKSELVDAAFRSVKRVQELPDTGSLREDLITSALEMITMCGSPERMGIIRMLHAEQQNPEVMAIRGKLRDESRARRHLMIDRAIARGELPASVNGALVLEAIFSPLSARLITAPEPTDEVWVRSLVDLVLAGARAQAAVRPVPAAI
jgi:AcrR family transcriptional regulator